MYVSIPYSFPAMKEGLFLGRIMTNFGYVACRAWVLESWEVRIGGVPRIAVGFLLFLWIMEKG